MTGEIKFALSSDSTCTNHLRSPVEGYETMTLRPKAQKAWPSHSSGQCELPEWAQGKWEHLHVQGGTVLLKDYRNFKTYTAKCVSQTGSNVHAERFMLYARTQCGDEHYKCVWFKNRGDNALEFQIGKTRYFLVLIDFEAEIIPISFSGLYTSPHHNDSLCSEENFQDRTWTTQGRVEVEDPTPYPIIGEYTGVIPDTDGLCAKLYSDCNNPEIMFYTIFNCFNRSEVFEGNTNLVIFIADDCLVTFVCLHVAEREYRCLGQWKEDGMIYTYTERRDLIGYECFVGLITAKGDIYLREAGHNCERGQEPLKYGMRLTQVSKCYGNPRFRWTTNAPARKPKATALPRWKERELNNFIDSGAGHQRVNFSAGLLATASLLVVSLCRSLFGLYLL